MSSLNPRILFVRSANEGRDFASIAFTRGEQFSEIVVRERVTGGLQFYLGKFSLPCNDREEGCLPADLLTEDVESLESEVIPVAKARRQAP